MRRWQLSIPLVVFAAILVVAFLSPSYVGLHCPSFAVECSDLAILHLTKAPSRFLSVHLPEGIGAAALVLLAAAVRPERVGRGMVLIAGTLVLVGKLAAVYLPGAIVPDPLQCGFIPAGDRFAGLIACGVDGGHADPRFALRYLVLASGLIAAGVFLIEAMIQQANGATEGEPPFRGAKWRTAQSTSCAPPPSCRLPDERSTTHRY